MIPEVITWSMVTTLIVVAGAVGGVWYRLYSAIEAERTARITQVAEERQTRILADAANSAQLSMFQLEVAKSYATQQSITQVEERVVQAIERLGDRLDKFLDNRTTRTRS